MLIELRGTEFNRRTNLFCGLGRFNRGLALIGFRTTGARLLRCYSRCLAIYFSRVTSDFWSKITCWFLFLSEMFGGGLSFCYLRITLRRLTYILTKFSCLQRAIVNLLSQRLRVSPVSLIGSWPQVNSLGRLTRLLSSRRLLALFALGSKRRLRASYYHQLKGFSLTDLKFLV